MNKIKNLLAVLLVVIITIACKENNVTGILITKKTPPTTLLNGVPNDSVFSNYYNNINWTNVVGMIVITQYSHSTWMNGQIQSGTGYSVSARTVADDQSTLKSEKLIGINGVALENIGEGNYYLSKLDYTPNFDINFGTGTNHISLDNVLNGRVLDADVSFQTPVNMTSITPLQNLSISQGFNFNFTPSNDGCIVYTSLNKNDSNNDTLFHNSIGLLNGYSNNSGNIIFPAYKLQALFKPGLYDLEISKENVQIITRTDGKKLAVFVQTINTKTVTLVP